MAVLHQQAVSAWFLPGDDHATCVATRPVAPERELSSPGPCREKSARESPLPSRRAPVDVRRSTAPRPVRMRQTVGVKRSTAIRHLVEMAEVATEYVNLLAQSPVDWPLVEMWVAGPLLNRAAEELDHGTVVLMIDLAPDELPWLAIHPTAEWVGEQLRLGKRPVSWSYRPAAWPAWTYRNPQVARFWSASNGLESGLIDELRSAATADLIEPDHDELIEQISVELDVSKAHLRWVLDQYWDRDWRRSNRHHASPEDQLWRAATAVIELQDALDKSGT